MQFHGSDLGELPGDHHGGVGVERASIVLSPRATSLSAARIFVSAMLEAWGREDPERVAELLTSELVSNAVRHAPGVIGLEVGMVDQEQVRVSASDEAAAAVVTPDFTRHGGEGGHGLKIIESLAQRWGVDRYDDHKVVWFESSVVPRHGI